MNEDHTHRLVARHLAGDADAGVELFRGIEQKIKGLLAFRIYNLTREDLQDLTQEAAGKIFRELHTFNPDKANFETFWRIIVNQVGVDHLRKATAQKRISGADLVSIDAAAGNDRPMEFAATGPGPDDETAKGEEFGLLRVALEKLGAFDVRCRHLFELFYFEENTYDEIAAQLKMNAKTVSTALVRCREKVREFFPKEFREQAQRYREPII